ncbi:MAG TPA: hypothetical protein VGE52_18115 [Pirellulales bacterium]
MRQKKRPAYLYRHLVSCGASEKAAATTAFQRRGVWHRIIGPGIQQAYPNAWFFARLCTLKLEWQKRHAPRRASGEQRVLFDP